METWGPSWTSGYHMKQIQLSRPPTQTQVHDKQQKLRHGFVFGKSRITGVHPSRSKTPRSKPARPYALHQRPTGSESAGNTQKMPKTYKNTQKHPKNVKKYRKITFFHFCHWETDMFRPKLAKFHRLRCSFARLSQHVDLRGSGAVNPSLLLVDLLEVYWHLPWCPTSPIKQPFTSPYIFLKILTSD